MTTSLIALPLVLVPENLVFSVEVEQKPHQKVQVVLLSIGDILVPGVSLAKTVIEKEINEEEMARLTWLGCL